MDSTLEFIKNKFGLDLNQKSPIEIPNFGRNQLADLVNELDFKYAVEVGVAAGEYSAILMKANPQLTLYGVDPWIPHKGYKDYVKQDTFNMLLDKAHERLDKYPNYHFVKKYSMVAVQDFADGSLDFVYLDGDHAFTSVANDVHYWLPKIRKGGILAGHDYMKVRNEAHIHVVEAVDGYTSAYDIKPWFVLGRRAKNEGLIRDNSRSWMFVKE